MKIILTHAYFLKDDPVEKKVMKPYFPLGLLYLSARLKKEGFPNEVYDPTFRNIDDMKKHLDTQKPEIIAIYSTLMTKLNVLKILAHIRHFKDQKSVKVIIGGPDTRYNAENYLQFGADIIIPGEGEETLSETVRVFNEDNIKGLPKIKGIIFRNKDGKIIKNTDRPFIPPDEWLFPSRESIDQSEYLTSWKEAHGYSSMTINTMRGCPHACNWCSKSVFGNTYRRRSPALVVKEMMLIRNSYHPDQLWFTDDVFTISRQWLRQFNDELIKNHILMPYECISRSESFDDEVLDILKASGCKKLWIGAESGSQKVIDLMNRKIDVEQTIAAINLAKAKGIETGTFLMLGYPGEMKSDIFGTAGYLKRACPDEFTIAMAYPIKGTKFYEDIESTFFEPFEWQKQTERQIRFKKDYSDRFYRFAVRYLMNTANALSAKSGVEKIIFTFKAFVSKIYLLLFK
jgi:anaerobic magnesium-protoporphyrin IX monomethyl ester cyclase